MVRTHRNEGRGAAEKGLRASGVDKRVLLALLDGGSREGDVAGKLLGGEGLASQRRLVDLLPKGDERVVPQGGAPLMPSSH